MPGVGLLPGPLGAAAQFLALAGGFGARHVVALRDPGGRRCGCQDGD
jgi:hypothetical protein